MSRRQLDAAHDMQIQLNGIDHFQTCWFLDVIRFST